MSRLDSVIRRLQAQRECLDYAVGEVKPLTGVVLELGLGNGRTFDHLRTRMPERDIYAFDRRVAAHPSCIPDDGHLFLGEIQDTLKQAAERFSGQCVLIHSDIGTGVEEDNQKMAKYLGVALQPFLKPGGILISDQQIELAGAVSLPLPEGIEDNRYFLLKMTAEGLL